MFTMAPEDLLATLGILIEILLMPVGLDNQRHNILIRTQLLILLIDSGPTGLGRGQLQLT